MTCTTRLIILKNLKPVINCSAVFPSFFSLENITALYFHVFSSRRVIVVFKVPWMMWLEWCDVTVGRAIRRALSLLSVCWGLVIVSGARVWDRRQPVLHSSEGSVTASGSVSVWGRRTESVCTTLRYYCNERVLISMMHFCSIITGPQRTEIWVSDW